MCYLCFVIYLFLILTAILIIGISFLWLRFFVAGAKYLYWRYLANESKLDKKIHQMAQVEVEQSDEYGNFENELKDLVN